MTDLVDIVLALHTSLDRAKIPHAFGGALALAYHIEEPRATRDVDVNVFVPVDQVQTVFAALPEGVAHSPADERRVRHDGQVRLFWGETPVDLFFSTDRFHDVAGEHRVLVPLAGKRIPVLDATELTVFKAFFNRTKDWADIEEMAACGTLDATVAVEWLDSLLGPDDPRTARLRGILEHPPEAGEPRFRR